MPTASAGIAGCRLSGPKMNEAFESCLERAGAATIATVDLDVAYQARFAGRSEKLRTIEFEILADVDKHFSKHLNYCVSFFHAGRTWLFMAQPRDYLPAAPNRLARLALKIPSHLIVSDVRRSVRVSVEPDCGLEFEMTLGGQPLPGARATDVGVGGMAVAFPEGELPALRVGSVVGVSLRLDDELVSLRAEVRHSENNHFGLEFPDIVAGDSYDPPEPYLRIIRALEKQWFAAAER